MTDFAAWNNLFIPLKINFFVNHYHLVDHTVCQYHEFFNFLISQIYLYDM